MIDEFQIICSRVIFNTYIRAEFQFKIDINSLIELKLNICIFLHDNNFVIRLEFTYAQFFSQR